MYVDASALCAILKNEPDRDSFISALKRDAEPFTSVVSVFETAMAITTLTGSCASASSEVIRFLEAAGIDVVPVDASHMNELALVRDRYGKGSGHPAQLNLGDCFSYAVAKSAGAAILYKGNDFAQTDLA
ncbi:MAG: type II toxin-antitoxin system VapC family toxin [Rhizobiaceae bacterium]